MLKAGLACWLMAGMLTVFAACGAEAPAPSGGADGGTSGVVTPQDGTHGCPECEPLPPGHHP